MVFTLEERRKIVCWMEVYGNVRRVIDLFEEHFETEPPSRQTVYNMHAKFIQHGTIHDLPRKQELDVGAAAVIQESFERSPKSIRKAARDLDIPK